MTRTHRILAATLTACATLTAAAPALAAPAQAAVPGTFIKTVSFGPNCPGHSSILSDDRRTLTVAFDGFDAAVGPTTPITERRKNCAVTLNMNTPLLTSYTVNTTINGFAQIPAGATGHIDNTTSANLTPSNVNRAFPAGTTGEYTKTFTTPSLLPGAGSTQPATINTIANLTGPTTNDGILSVDTIDFKIN
ncbi:DUF4360 domain-containing protein [Streptomyces sp. NPDC051563]|uniref:DUF4360 domain-containing protein n=1 Tax=Streptomyces sp. NPDC051563 TaxID=3365659 RepID=UPI0037929E94